MSGALLTVRAAMVTAIVVAVVELLLEMVLMSCCKWCYW